MKLKQLVAACLIVGSGIAAGAEISESVEAQRPRLGVQVGANFSNVSGPSDVNADHRTGFAAGARIAFPMTPYVSLQPEALFVQRGVTLAKVGAYTMTAKYNTLQVPLLVKAHLPYKDVSPYITAGPIAFFNLSSSVDVGGPGGAVAGTSFNPRTFELGGSIGAGLDIGPLFVAANYLIGFTQLDENSASYHSRGVQLLGGVQF